jgi:hypothetical protein
MDGTDRRNSGRSTKNNQSRFTRWVAQNAKEIGAYRQHHSSTATTIPREKLPWSSLQHGNLRGSSKLATVSTALHECLEFISKMTTSQAKQFETVAELINIYVYKTLTDDLNSAHKKNMHESFEMALYWSYLEMNRNDNLRQRTIDQIQRILKDAPVNDHFLPLLWKGFAECQSKWVQKFLPRNSLVKTKSFIGQQDY